MATKAQIQVSVTGFKQLQNLQASVKALAPQIDKANAAFIRLSGASKQTLPVVANLRKVLEESKAAFQASVLGSKAAIDAAKNQVVAERALNSELERRNKLLNQVRANPVEKSIARNQASPNAFQVRKKKFETGFTGFSERADEVAKATQQELVQQQRLQIQIKKEELAVTEAIARAENRRLDALAEQVVKRKRQQVSGRIERQRITNPKFGEVAGSSFGRRGGSIGPALPSSGAGSTIRSMNRTGFAAFSKRASAIERTTKAEIALAKSRSTILQKTRQLASIERRRAKAESFGANLKRFGRGRTSADRAVRGRVASSALIGGGFPLLFGGGPIPALAGGLGGAIGELFGKGGGFAGSIAATAVAQTIQQAITAIGELGQAMGSFTQDTQAITQAMGLQGSAQAAQLKLIEQTEGKTAAFNAAMNFMATQIGQKGVNSLKRFGENSRMISATLGLAITKLQALGSSILNFILRISGVEQRLKKEEQIRTVKFAASRGNEEAKGILAEQKRIDAIPSKTIIVSQPGVFGGSVGIPKKIPSKESVDAQKALDIRIAQFDVREKERINLNRINDIQKDHVQTLEQEFALVQRVNELVKNGTDKGLAQKLAKNEQINKEAVKNIKIRQDEVAKQLEALDKIEDKNDFQKQQVTDLLTIEKFLTEELNKQPGILDNMNKKTIALHDGVDKVKGAFQDLSKSIQNDIKEGIKGLIKGTSTLADMLNNVADKFLDLALNQALFGNAAGSSVTGGLFKFLGFKANGGPVAGGKSYVVGEKGPELFVPKSSGTIVPNNQLGGGGSTSVVVNVDASGTSAEGDEPDAAQLGRLIGSVVQAELIKESRPGGLLSSTR